MGPSSLISDQATSQPPALIRYIAPRYGTGPPHGAPSANASETRRSRRHQKRQHPNRTIQQAQHTGTQPVNWNSIDISWSNLTSPHLTPFHQIAIYTHQAHRMPAFFCLHLPHRASIHSPPTQTSPSEHLFPGSWQLSLLSGPSLPASSSSLTWPPLSVATSADFY